MSIRAEFRLIDKGVVVETEIMDFDTKDMAEARHAGYINLNQPMRELNTWVDMRIVRPQEVAHES